MLKLAVPQYLCNYNYIKFWIKTQFLPFYILTLLHPVFFNYFIGFFKL